MVQTGQVGDTRGDRVALLIAGMHRSGTSALARTFSLLGAGLPKNVMPANPGNLKGHWEPERVVLLNDEWIQSLGSDLYSVVDINAGWFDTPEAEEATKRAQALLQEEFGDQPVIVLKDPRVCLFLPIWQHALERLGYRVCNILPLRPPAAVADSLRRRHLQELSYDAWPPPRAELVWLRYTVAAERHSRGDRITVSFEDLLSDWQSLATSIATRFDFVWPIDLNDAAPDVESFLDREARQSAADFPVTGDLIGHPTADLSGSGLADGFYDALRTAGEAGSARLDELAGEYHRRVGGLADMLTAFEGMYPLIWEMHEQVRRSGLPPGLPSGDPDQLGAMVRGLWQSTMELNGEKVALAQDLHDARVQIDELADALRSDPSRLLAAGEIEQSLRRQLQEAEGRAAALAADLQAIRLSTSWRITGPLRRAMGFVRRG